MRDYRISRSTKESWTRKRLETINIVTWEGLEQTDIQLR
jgi:hypothetical protein